MVRTWPNAAMGRYAVKLKWLEDFASNLDPELSTAEVVTELVIPQTKNSGCRFVDIMDPKHVGCPDFFISHRWGAKFSTLVRVLIQHFRDADVRSEWWLMHATGLVHATPTHGCSRCGRNTYQAASVCSAPSSMHAITCSTIMPPGTASHF